MKTLDDKVVVITGAGSGIGRALALDVARRGSLLALSDVDEAGLAETVAQAERAGAVRVRSDRLDVADREAFARELDGRRGIAEQLHRRLLPVLEHHPPRERVAGQADVVVAQRGVAAERRRQARELLDHRSSRPRNMIHANNRLKPPSFTTTGTGDEPFPGLKSP